jgi:hypothetical protein
MDSRTVGVAGVIQVWLPILTVVAGGVWGLFARPIGATEPPSCR